MKSAREKKTSRAAELRKEREKEIQDAKDRLEALERSQRESLERVLRLAQKYTDLYGNDRDVQLFHKDAQVLRDALSEMGEA
jgi:hypothetical protein